MKGQCKNSVVKRPMLVGTPVPRHQAAPRMVLYNCSAIWTFGFAGAVLPAPLPIRYILTLQTAFASDPFLLLYRLSGDGGWGRGIKKLIVIPTTNLS